MDPLASAVGLGFVLGVQHATDPDHLVAVAAIVTRERRFADGAPIGALWGLGHPVALASPLRRARTALAVDAGVGSIAFGIVYAVAAV